MDKKFLLAICIGALALPLAACDEQDTVATELTFGPSPTLPAPEHSWIPTVNIANATWFESLIQRFRIAASPSKSAVAAQPRSMKLPPPTRAKHPASKPTNSNATP